MSLVDRTRTVRPTRDSTSGGPSLRDDLSWHLLVPGARAAASSWLVLALPALLAWVVAPLSSVSWLQALGVAGAGWYLALGMPLTLARASISVAPLGITLLALWISTRSVRRLLDDSEAAARGTTWPAVLVRRLVPGYLLGHLVVALVVWLTTLAGPVRPSVLGVLGTLWLPVVALVVGLVRRYDAGEAAPLVGPLLDRAPRWLSRSLVPGLRGGGVLLAAGLLVVVVAVVVRHSTVTGLHSALGAGVVGGTVLVLGQLLVLPDLGVWALSWLSGPGFTVGADSTVTLGQAHPGLLPLVPVLGALPQGGTFSPWLRLLLLVPVLVGGLVAVLARRDLARLSTWRTKLSTSVAACGVAALVVLVAATFASGSLGVDRLTHVGTRPWLLALVVLGELLLGSSVVVGLDRLRGRG